MEIATIRQAKINLSSLVERAERGEEVVIARGKHPVVRLVPVKPAATKRTPGLFAGELKLGPAFFEPLPPEEMEGWE